MVFKEGFLAIFRLKNKWLFIGYSLIIWGLYFLMSYAVMFAFDETAHLGMRRRAHDIRHRRYRNGRTTSRWRRFLSSSSPTRLGYALRNESRRRSCICFHIPRMANTGACIFWNGMFVN